jgi:hypothetical protein
MYLPLRALQNSVPVVILAALLIDGARAAEYAPRVVSPHHADAYSMKTFAQYPRWRDLKGDKQAWEVFQYLADERTGLFPLGQPVLEGRDVLSEFQTIRDPVKLINVYGYGYCGILGPTVAGVCRDMGMGPSRTLVLPGWHHVVGEVYYDDKWHYLDLDCRAAFRRSDGSLASMAEAQRDETLWKGPNSPLFFPLDPLGEVRKAYAKTAVEPYNGYHFSDHTMDYVLRQGETFTRWWKPQQGRWHHIEACHKDEHFRRLFEREPRGPKCKHTGWTIHSHGNGRFVYRPDLTDRSTDFGDGVYDSNNIRPGGVGLTLRQHGEGYAIFEVRSPYVIVPLVGKMETTNDDREASIVKVDATGATMALSLDNGLSWRELAAPRLAEGGSETLDLTAHVSGSYGYLLKINLKGEPGKAVLRGLEMTTWVQLAPASLPGLRKGSNRMEYRTGDHYGLASRVVESRTNGSDRADFFQYLHEPPKDFDPQRAAAGRARGPFIAKVEAPPHTKIARFSAGGNFVTHQRDGAKATGNTMAYAVNEPKDFQMIYRAEVPTDQSHWHYNAEREIKLDQPAKVVYIRYEGDPGVNNLRIYAHCVDDQPGRRSSVAITHAWTENGVPKTRKVTLDKPGPYEVVAEGDPVDGYVEIAVPSSGQK